MLGSGAGRKAKGTVAARVSLGQGGLGDVEQVPRGKPAPDAFLFAAAERGVLPARCAVVEDGAAGVTAGHRCGHACLWLRGSHTRCPSA
jgi:HAD superfamily hydrolase (TIGR01509 family)